MIGFLEELRRGWNYPDGPAAYFWRYHRNRRELVEPWKIPAYLYHKLAKELYWPDHFEAYYEAPSDKRALILTHIDPFRRNPTTYDPRPGRWSKVENARIINELGYSTDIYFIASDESPDDFDQYDLLMGAGEKFVEYAKKIPEGAVKIYYNGGMYEEQVIEAYKHRLRELEARKGLTLQPERANFFDRTNAISVADAVIVMGDEFTAETYGNLDIPVYNIRTTHPPGYVIDIDAKNFETARRKFVWFGGTGPVLKGLDRVLEAFETLPELELTVCGPVQNNPEFVKLYEEELFGRDNIHPMGWVDLRSQTFQEIVETVGFLVYPSGSEGSSGAVAACRWRGLIPLITKEVIADTDGWGITLDDANVETLIRTVKECSNRDPDELRTMAEMNLNSARKDYGRARYSAEMRAILTDILDPERQPGNETNPVSV